MFGKGSNKCLLFHVDVLRAGAGQEEKSAPKESSGLKTCTVVRARYKRSEQNQRRTQPSDTYPVCLGLCHSLSLYNQPLRATDGTGIVPTPLTRGLRVPQLGGGITGSRILHASIPGVLLTAHCPDGQSTWPGDQQERPALCLDHSTGAGDRGRDDTKQGHRGAEEKSE